MAVCLIQRYRGRAVLQVQYLLRGSVGSGKCIWLIYYRFVSMGLMPCNAGI